jgi:hypothetical protein
MPCMHTMNDSKPSSETTITYDIDDPADARTYIKTWAPRLLGKKADYVQTNFRRITFATMSDDDACLVARLLWGMEKKAP